MSDALLIINCILLAIILIKQFIPTKSQGQLEKNVREEIARNREELSSNLKMATDSLSKQIIDMTQMNENKLEKIREVVGEQLRALQEDNSAKLEKMRETVDEKLHSTLEKRLNDSFKVVSDRLEKVHEGLGEMQNLATGVGDLKKVLSNVKTRGILGEYALENLIEQILTPGQYEKNFVTKAESRDPVEFVIKLPDALLPIDAKFPKEDYEKLVDAQEAGDVAAANEFGKAIERTIKEQAKKIKDKYIEPPTTTNFAIMFLPFEGLYAEVLRRPGLFEHVQSEYRIIIAGPTTLSAILNSFRIGFSTLAIQERANDVWSLLGVVKSEFGKFGTILEKTKEKLEQASNTIDKAASKSRTIERKLKKVEELPTHQNTDLLTNDELDIVIDEPSKDETAV